MRQGKRQERVGRDTKENDRERVRGRMYMDWIMKKSENKAECPFGRILAGKYELREKIGEGGSGIVRLAWDRHLERQVAVKAEKSVRQECAVGEGERTDLLRQEMELLKKLQHPMLPAVYDYFCEDCQYLVMEYIPGISLHNYIEKEGCIPEETVCRWAVQLLELLKYLHGQKPPVIYRDLKPENIIVCPDGNLRVVDFGAALRHTYEQKRQNSLAGTAGYAAPEQFGEGEQLFGRADERSDIYTFGATLYHMLTGYDPSLPPYGIRPVRSMNPALSAKMEQIVGRCTRTDPARRYQSAEEILWDLERKRPAGRHIFLGIGKKRERYVLRRMEKNIRLTEKKSVGLFAAAFLLGGFFMAAAGLSVKGREAPLPVIVYNTQGQKVLIRYGSIYQPDGNLLLELEQGLFSGGEVRELSVCLTNPETGDKRERIFYIQGED